MLAHRLRGTGMGKAESESIDTLVCVCIVKHARMHIARAVLLAKWCRIRTAKNTARVGFQQNPICEEFA